MKISEIFLSIEGEGARSGLLCVFIRLHGCNLNCTYCDSRYACEGADYTEMSIHDIVDKVSEFKTPRVTITGGEPLIHKDIKKLILALLNLTDMHINIETNGSVLFDTSYLGSNKDDRIMITMDWKSISSGMSDKMQDMNLCYLTKNDVLKFVVGTDEDLEQMKDVVEHNDLDCQLYVSPVFGQIELPKIVAALLKYHLNNVRMQLQIHKIIWDPDKRGV